jgi:D-3-phosphoglycerate dehydrogenase / 2-oxoglutarate reductase
MAELMVNSSAKKILFVDSNHPLLHESLQNNGFICDLNYNWTEQQIIENIAAYDGIVIRSKIKITSSIIDRASKLRFIARAGAGMENIDVIYAEQKGIKCIHAPEGNRDAVSEHALAMILALFNNICKANQEVRNGIWLREENRGIELQGKTIGIIGYGNMGSAFAKRLTGFGVNILVYDKYKQKFGTSQIKESNLSEIFNQADVISLHTPLTDETHYLINDSFIQSFKKNIYIINTARGKCLNTADLVKNLESGKVLGACLDVLEFESLSFENIDSDKLPTNFKYLIKSNKVMLSPHVAGWTVESHQKIAATLLDKILAIYQA